VLGRENEDSRCLHSLHQQVLPIPGLFGVSHFRAGLPREANDKHDKQENAGNGNRGSCQKKIRTEALNQSGHQLQYEPHTQSVAEEAHSKRRQGIACALRIPNWPQLCVVIFGCFHNDLRLVPVFRRI